MPSHSIICVLAIRALRDVLPRCFLHLCWVLHKLYTMRGVVLRWPCRPALVCVRLTGIVLGTASLGTLANACWAHDQGTAVPPHSFHQLCQILLRCQRTLPCCTLPRPNFCKGQSGQLQLAVFPVTQLSPHTETQQGAPWPPAACRTRQGLHTSHALHVRDHILQEKASKKPTLASCSLPCWFRGRSRAAWRTKNTRIRAAMRSSRAPAKLGTAGAGRGTNRDSSSALHMQVFT